MSEVNKYQNGKIYKIEPINGEEEDIYIGSTTQKYLSSRMNTHRSGYLKKTNFCKSHSLFDKYGVENCNIILLEMVNVNNKMELQQREAYYIKLLKCVNKVIPLRTQKEYYETNKDKILEKTKEYQKTNKDKIKEYREANKDKIKEWIEDNKDKIKEQRKEFRELNKDKLSEQKKEYYETNKDKILEQKKEHYETNKDKILVKVKEYREANIEKIKEYDKQRQYQEMFCECCKKNINKREKTKHYKTKLHIKNMEQQI